METTWEYTDMGTMRTEDLKNMRTLKKIQIYLAQMDM